MPHNSGGINCKTKVPAGVGSQEAVFHLYMTFFVISHDRGLGSPWHLPNKAIIPTHGNFVFMNYLPLKVQPPHATPGREFPGMNLESPQYSNPSTSPMIPICILQRSSHIQRQKPGWFHTA